MPTLFVSNAAGEFYVVQHLTSSKLWPLQSVGMPAGQYHKDGKDMSLTKCGAKASKWLASIARLAPMLEIRLGHLAEHYASAVEESSQSNRRCHKSSRRRTPRDQMHKKVREKKTTSQECKHSAL